jgi:hypothetical protein
MIARSADQQKASYAGTPIASRGARGEMPGNPRMDPAQTGTTTLTS